MDEPRAQELMHDINLLRRAVRRRLRAGAAQPALSLAQIEVLQAIEEQPGTGVSAVARALRLADNSVSGLVNQLVGAGLVRRDTDPRDRRAVCLWLTPAAGTRLATWRAARTELVAAGLARLDAQDRQRIARALPALRRLTDILTEEAT